MLRNLISPSINWAIFNAASRAVALCGYWDAGPSYMGLIPEQRPPEKVSLNVKRARTSTKKLWDNDARYWHHHYSGRKGLSTEFSLLRTMRSRALGMGNRLFIFNWCVVLLGFHFIGHG